MTFVQKNSLWMSIIIAGLLIGFNLWAEGFANEFQSVERSPFEQYSPLIMSLLLVEILLFTLSTYPKALLIGLMAGILWLAAGDLLAAPYWVTLTVFCVQTINAGCNLSSRESVASAPTVLHLLLLIGSTVCYNIAWSGTTHYWYLAGLALLLFITFRVYRQDDEPESEQEEYCQCCDDEDCEGCCNEICECCNDEDCEGCCDEICECCNDEDCEGCCDEICECCNDEECEGCCEQCCDGCCEQCCDGCEECETARPFEADVRRLESLKKLPTNLDKEIKGIIQYSRLIQDCMLTDPCDVEPARKFLQRYLPATREIVEKGLDLSHKLQKQGTRQDLDAHKLTTLKALHSAFRQKHAQLLENNTTHLKTEMSTLEKLLKTDGFL